MLYQLQAAVMPSSDQPVDTPWIIVDSDGEEVRDACVVLSNFTSVLETQDSVLETQSWRSTANNKKTQTLTLFKCSPTPAYFLAGVQRRWGRFSYKTLKDV